MKMERTYESRDDISRAFCLIQVNRHHGRPLWESRSPSRSVLGMGVEKDLDG